MQDLLDLIERKLGAAWLDLSAWLREQNQLEDIEAMLRVGDFAGITDTIRQAAARFASDEAASYATAGSQAATWLDGQVESLVHFDVANAGAVRWAQQNRLELMQGLTLEQRQTIHQVLVAGAQTGTNPRVVAREIRDGLGLTPSQQGWVASYRRALEAGDMSDALGRELSHGYSDRAIASAMRRSVSLTPEQIDTAVERYRANVVAYRAENIARTEGLRVAHQGVEESLRQAVERGNVNAAAIERTWNTAHDGRVRESHREMNGQTRAMGVAFESGSGAQLAYPGDPRAPIAEVAQCRCALSTRYRPARAA